jgi:hypothetical protein
VGAPFPWRLQLPPMVVNDYTRVYQTAGTFMTHHLKMMVPLLEHTLLPISAVMTTPPVVTHHQEKLVLI